MQTLTREQKSRDLCLLYWLSLTSLSENYLISRFSYCFKGDSSDYELLRHQLADPEIKVQQSVWAHTCYEVNSLFFSALSPSPLTGCSDHQLASGVSELCDPADKRPRTAHLYNTGERGTVQMLLLLLFIFCCSGGQTPMRCVWQTDNQIVQTCFFCICIPEASMGWPEPGCGGGIHGLPR